MVDKKINFLSYSYVIIWKKPLLSIPGFNLETLRNLFENPALTQVDSSPNGLTISMLKKIEIPFDSKERVINIEPPISPFIVINNAIMHNFNPNLEGLLRTHNKLTSLIKEGGVDLSSSFISGQLGINIDFELSIEPLSSREWFGKRLFSEKFKNNKEVLGTQMAFRVVIDKTNVINVNVQPRANNDNAIFVSINNHFNDSPDYIFEDSNKFEKIFEDSIIKIKDIISPILLD